MPDNGTLESANREVTLPAGTLRRLARMHARVEGAQLVMNTVHQYLQQMQEVLKEALTEACDEQGVTIPGGGSAPIDIDWRTGVVRIGTPEMPPPIPMGAMRLPEGPSGFPS